MIDFCGRDMHSVYETLNNVLYMWVTHWIYIEGGRFYLIWTPDLGYTVLCGEQLKFI